MDYNAKDASLTRRSAMANTTVGGANAFRSSPFGFNKESVLFYIDNLCRDAAEQERKLSAQIDQLTAKNRTISKTITEYEQRLQQVSQQLKLEQQRSAETQQREDMFRQMLGQLQQQVAQMQGGLQLEQQKSQTLYQRYAAAENEVRQLRAQMANYANAQYEIANRDQMLRQRAAELQQQGALLQRQQQEINALRQQAAYSAQYGYNPNMQAVVQQKDGEIAQREHEILALRQQVQRLTQHIQKLEGQRTQITDAIYDARYAPQQPAAEQQAYGQVQHYNRQADSMQQHLGQVGGQLGAIQNSIGQMQQQAPPQPYYAQPAQQQPQQARKPIRLYDTFEIKTPPPALYS